MTTYEELLRMVLETTREAQAWLEETDSLEIELKEEAHKTYNPDAEDLDPVEW